jgi:NAD(P)-dependent dehydrogenase (short-subunit alcohol dehydrogenase family)
MTVDFDFRGKVFLVAGGSRGIGADAARAFARAGASVVIGARDTERLEQLTAEITADGGRAVAGRWPYKPTSPRPRTPSRWSTRRSVSSVG